MTQGASRGREAAADRAMGHPSHRKLTEKGDLRKRRKHQKRLSYRRRLLRAGRQDTRVPVV